MPTSKNFKAEHEAAKAQRHEENKQRLLIFKRMLVDNVKEIEPPRGQVRGPRKAKRKLKRCFSALVCVMKLSQGD